MVPSVFWSRQNQDTRSSSLTHETSHTSVAILRIGRLGNAVHTSLTSYPTALRQQIPACFVHSLVTSGKLVRLDSAAKNLHSPFIHPLVSRASSCTTNDRSRQLVATTATVPLTANILEHNPPNFSPIASTSSRSIEGSRCCSPACTGSRLQRTPFTVWSLEVHSSTIFPAIFSVSC